MPKTKTTRQSKGMGRLYKRDATGKEVPANSKKPGTYWLAYRDSTGKRVKQRLEVDGKSVTDYELAKREQLRLRAPYLTGSRIEVLKSVEADLRRLEQQQELEADRANPPLAIADAWEAYVNATNRPECGEETLGYYRTTWQRLVDWLAATYPEEPPVYLRDVTEEMASAHMAAMRQKEWTANTYNKHLAFLKLLFRVLAKPARMTANPFADITRRKMTNNSRRELTIEELHRVLTSATGDLRLLFELGTFTGLRLGDCCTLRWGEIDLARGIIRRKPNKTLHSSGAEVVIGIPGVLYRELLAVPAESRTGYVLPGMAARYQTKNTRSYLCKEIQAHFAACGIETHAPGTGSRSHYEGKKKVYEKTKRAVVLVGFHSLRHTYASLHAASGTPAPLIQENMGHSSPGMTEHYTHVSDDTARRVAAALDLPQLTSADAEIGGAMVEEMRQQLLQVVKKADGALLQRLLHVAGAGADLPALPAPLPDIK